MKKKERIIYESPSTEIYSITIETNLLQISGGETQSFNLGDYGEENA